MYFILVPVILWYAIFCYAPMYGIVMAFQDYIMSRGYFRSSFVGLKHFVALYHDSYFRRAFYNTAIIAVYRVVTIFPFSIILALILNEIRRMAFRKTVQTIIYVPHFLSWVIVASIFLTFFNPEKGIIAAINEITGKRTLDILINPNLFRHILILTDIWKEAGFSTVIYVAGIAGIDPILYEAAIVDGAGRWAQIWHITLPGIKSVIVISFILLLGNVLTWGFDQIFNFYNPMVYSTGDILGTYIYRTAMADMKFSYGAAAGLFQSVICAVLLLSSNYALRKMGETSIY